MAAIGFRSFWLNWLLTTALLVLTFNPQGWSYYHWLRSTEGWVWPGLAGIVLLAALALVARQTWRGLGPVGILLAAGLLVSISWWSADIGRLDLFDQRIIAWVPLLILSTVAAIGITWTRVAGRRHRSDS